MTDNAGYEEEAPALERVIDGSMTDNAGYEEEALLIDDGQRWL
jgi:hypothetical protein